MRFLIFLLPFAVIGARASPARAQDWPTTAEAAAAENERGTTIADVGERKDSDRRWYGWQTLLVDGAAIALLTGGLRVGELGVAGATTYVLGPPLVHGVHGNGGTAAASVGVRLFMPFGLALAGFGLGTSGCRRDSSNDCPLVMMTLGFFSGMAAATTLDASLFAFERRTPEPATTPARAVTGKLSVGVLPVVHQRHASGATVSAGYVF